MTTFRVILLVLVVGILACKPNTKKNAVPQALPTEEMDKKEMKSSESISLYDRYYPNPRNRAEEEENLIIDYITEHNLSMEYSPEGVYYQVVKSGNGKPIRWGQSLQVHYKGYRLDGVEFDNSYKRGKPISFRVGQMIDGWNHTLKRMKTGDEALIIIPSRLGYGNEGRGTKIRANDVLIFEIKVEE